MKKIILFLLLLPVVVWAGSSNFVNTVFVPSDTIPSGPFTLEDSGAATTNNDGWIMYGSDRRWHSIQFTASSSYSIQKVELELLEIGTIPTDYPMTMYIYTDNSNEPGTLIGSAINSINTSALDSSADWYVWYFNGVSVTSGTVYWIVFGNNAYYGTTGNNVAIRTNSGESGLQLRSDQTPFVWQTGRGDNASWKIYSGS